MSYHASCYGRSALVLILASLPCATTNCGGDNGSKNASTGGSTSTLPATVGGATTGRTASGGTVSLEGASQGGGAATRTVHTTSGGATQSSSASGGATQSSSASGGATQSSSANGGTASIGGASQVGGASTATGSGWVEEWSNATAPRFYTRGDAPSSVQLDVVDPAARDSSALSLTLGANPKPRPLGGAEVGTNTRLGFGTFASRLRTAVCTGQSDAGVVTGLFTYFNDGKDTTGDGLPDNSEIDFEWLCAEPQTIYLTMWTDYRDNDGAQKRVGRAINLATGTILYTCYYTAFGDCTETLTGVEATPGTISALAGYDSSSSYYEYGFDWKAERVVWWMTNPTTGARIVLWDYRGPSARITQIPAAFLTNVWHTTDWPPEGKPNAVQAPTEEVTVGVDWTSYSLL